MSPDWKKPPGFLAKAKGLFSFMPVPDSTGPAEIVRADRRSQGRCPANEIVELRLNFVKGYEIKDDSISCCFAGDISEEGLRFACATALPIGTRLKLYVSMKLPPATFIHLGEVRWNKRRIPSSDHWVGVQFTGASGTFMEDWKRVVQQMRFLTGTPDPEFTFSLPG